MQKRIQNKRRRGTKEAARRRRVAREVSERKLDPQKGIRLKMRMKS